MRKAKLYTHHDTYVECQLCAHGCRIKEGKKGICRVRQNVEGELYTLVYGKTVAQHVDPIEKKPLFHFLPGTLTYSIATRGCNFRCLHCQNSSISQITADLDPAGFTVDVTAQQVVKNAVDSGCASISYTYSEPTVFFEFTYDCCREAAEHSVGNVMVSNGYMSSQAAQMLSPYLDAVNIDLKSFRDDFYRKVCGARLQPVLDTITLLRKLGVWVEVTTLVIPGVNDSTEELRELASFLVNVDGEIPWHVTAFHPSYQMREIGRTPPETLSRAREIGFSAGLKYVYEGNIPGSGGENSYCPGCGMKVISRYGFSIDDNRIINDRCPECSNLIAGVWS